MYAAFGSYWEWANQSKVTFDGENKLVLVNPGVTDLNIKDDVYSNWKEWEGVYDYMKYEQAFRAVGGDPLPSGDNLGATFFLMNGWKMRTWEGSHTLDVVGNIYTESGQPVFVPTLGDWNILVNSTVSNLIYKVNNDLVAAMVWDELLANHGITGSTGKALKDTLKILKVLLASA